MVWQFYVRGHKHFSAFFKWFDSFMNQSGSIWSVNYTVVSENLRIQDLLKSLSGAIPLTCRYTKSKLWDA
jgi:hypothetical protein